MLQWELISLSVIIMIPSDRTPWDMTGAMLSKMREETYLCDFTMTASDFDDTRELIVAHSVVMAASCSLFHQFFVTKCSDLKIGETMHVAEVDTYTLKVAVDFVYGKKTTSPNSILALSEASKILGIPAAKKYLQKCNLNPASEFQSSKNAKNISTNVVSTCVKGSSQSISPLPLSPSNETCIKLENTVEITKSKRVLGDASLVESGPPNLTSNVATTTEATSQEPPRTLHETQRKTYKFAKLSYEEIEDWSRLCNVCDVKTSGIIELNRHLETSHKFERCTKCSITLEVNQLKKHRINCHQTDPRCRRCTENKFFEYPMLLLEHILLEHHSDELYFCSLCAYNTVYHNEIVYHFAQNHEIVSPFKYLIAMNLILTKHNVPNVMVLKNIVYGNGRDGDNWKELWLTSRFYCCYCSTVHMNVFSLSECIRQHLQSDRDKFDFTANNVHACWRCDETFADYKQYELHGKCHKDVFVCDICGVITYTIKKMKEHNSYVHCGLRPYKCEICDKAFRDRTTLRDHHITHSDIETFLCPHCGKRFKFRQSYNRHLTVLHDPNYIRPCACNICSYRAHTMSKLEMHYEVVHSGKLFPCDICGKQFKCTAKVRIHKRKFHGISSSRNML